MKFTLLTFLRNELSSSASEPVPYALLFHSSTAEAGKFELGMRRNVSSCRDPGFSSKHFLNEID